MTNKQFAKSYFDQAKSIYETINHHYRRGEWHLVVRRAQEVVELILKGLLRQIGVEVPRLHDVGNLIKKEAGRLPPTVRGNLDTIVSVSRRLRQERETSFYGDEQQELPPSMLYTVEDADQAIKDVKFIVSLMKKS